MSQVRTFISATGIGIGGYLLIGIWSGILLGALYFTTGAVLFEQELFVSNLGLLMGAVTTTALFFQFTDHRYQFLRVRPPTSKELVLAVGGVVVLLAGAIGLEFLLGLFDVGTSDHQIYEAFTTQESPANPTILLALIPISILIIGPCEELIFRGLVQGSLYQSFDRQYAILVTSVIFAMVHFPAYLTASAADATSTLLIVLFLSLILGWLYETTDNLIVPSLAHGIYNAVLFLFLYFEVTGVV
ncbi:CPBP family intramembrane glutamic endopeptidase [Halorubrum sp. AJ67]|uniref:CPBP family intramembrane glutamic endopeptidase n=1 Tax=Halorubrum sp. AJ67 TaxID=1173487 RepID=UPI0003DBF0EE|nr:CPBP family intramembrane glutamic endopeptidase [Halorubrum sp. AJ67]CDK38280.1 abortive infection protein [Halorubrum sp. AJ67]